MMTSSSSKYSTTAVDGSAYEFGSSPSISAQKTPAHQAEQREFTIQRIKSFISDTSMHTIVAIHARNANAIVAARQHAAAANIASFDEAFDKHNGNKKYKENN
ncbi:hypothetical protein ONS96_003810 [Cadophora gregata f. sp. sojae]|nr:hypothetical protein ONS96_003810 [Cadophora gregata f. sp. sojae]